MPTSTFLSVRLWSCSSCRGLEDNRIAGHSMVQLRETQGFIPYRNKFAFSWMLFSLFQQLPLSSTSPERLSHA
jgi:hypothetical protein